MIVNTQIGQITIDQGKISKREELADASADIVDAKEPKISKNASRRVFAYSSSNVLSRPSAPRTFGQ